MFHVQEVNNPSHATDVCTAFNLRGKKKENILWKSVLSIKWLLGSEKMTDSFCSYEKWLFLSDFNYEPLNWMFCCYPRKNSIGEKSNLQLCDNQSKATTNGLCLYALYYMKEKKMIWYFFSLRDGGRRGLGSIKISLYEDQNIFPVEFYQTKRGDLFLWNLFLKRAGQFSSNTLISKDLDQAREHFKNDKQNHQL